MFSPVILLMTAMYAVPDSQPAPDGTRELESPYRVENHTISAEESLILQRGIGREVDFLKNVLKTKEADAERKEHDREIRILERAVIDLAVIEILLEYQQFGDAARRMDSVLRQLGSVESVFGTKQVPMFMSYSGSLRKSLQCLVLRHLNDVKKAYGLAGIDAAQFSEPVRVIKKSLYRNARLVLEEEMHQPAFGLQKRVMKSMSKYQCYLWAGKPLKHRDDTWWYEGKDGSVLRCEFNRGQIVVIEDESEDE